MVGPEDGLLVASSLTNTQLTEVIFALIGGSVIVSLGLIGLAGYFASTEKDARNNINDLISDPGAKLTPLNARGEPKRAVSLAEQTKAVASLAETLIALSPSLTPLYLALVPVLVSAAVVLTVVLDK